MCLNFYQFLQVSVVEFVLVVCASNDEDVCVSVFMILADILWFKVLCLYQLIDAWDLDLQ